jgi:protein DGCR14
VQTPDVAPDPEALAFTWGEIASTPIRLDAEETPVDIGGWGGVGGTPGLRFKVNRTPARDEVLRGLAHGGGGFGRAGKASPSPARNPGGNRTPALGGGFDAALRGSYSGRMQTPSRRTPGGGSGRATPVAGGTPVRGTPSRRRDGGARPTRNSLTDDLLDV